MSIFSNNISVREIEKADFGSIVDYFLNADKDFLLSMGVDCSKLPKREDWLNLLADEYELPFGTKSFFYVIWQLDNMPVGHSNINKIVFGKEAYMHLHLWEPGKRGKGAGVELTKLSLPFYFDRFKLDRLYCEPSAFNLAPNRTLEKLGFEFVRQHDTIPGWINSYQTVNTWCLDVKKYQTLISQTASS
jgi:RimJ/RimL family protein N-acetyltransferase